MKKGCNIIMFFYVLIIVVYFSSTVSHAKGFDEIYSKVLQDIHGEVVEFGLKYEFKIDSEGKLLVSEIFDRLSLKSEGMDVSIVDENYQYCIEFNSKNTKGYIQYIKNPEEKIIINIVEEDTLNKMQGIKARVKELADSMNTSSTCFQYIKARTKIDDLQQAKNLVETSLKNSRALNVKSIEISDGYSIMALSGSEKPMKVGEDLININCAVCRYKSGNYLIIGTPVINTNY